MQVSPKLNDGFEIDYVRMLNEALSETDNYETSDGFTDNSL